MLSSVSVTPIERVPGSAAGAMRAMRAVTGSSLPSTLTCTVMPGESLPTSCVPTRPASSSLDRSTMVSTCCSAATFSPGSVCRLATMPSIGEISAAWRSSTSLVPSCACADSIWPRADSSCARELSSAVGAMKFCEARPWLALYWRSDCSYMARADSTLALRSATLWRSSSRSSWPSDWPALTRLPSPTVRRSRLPEALARTITVLGATSGPENSIRPGIGAIVGLMTSPAWNSRAGLAASFFAAGALLPLVAYTPAPPARTATATPPNHHCLRMISPIRRHGITGSMILECGGV